MATEGIERPENLAFEYPPGWQFPVVYADGVLSTARGRGVVKFYLFRVDPSIVASGGNRSVPIAQVVMPNHAFAAMAVFFHKQLEALVRDDPELAEHVTNVLADLSKATTEPA